MLYVLWCNLLVVAVDVSSFSSRLTLLVFFTFGANHGNQSFAHLIVSEAHNDDDNVDFEIVPQADDDVEMWDIDSENQDDKVQDRIKGLLISV